MNKQDLVLNNIQELRCLKTKPTNQSTKQTNKQTNKKKNPSSLSTYSFFFLSINMVIVVGNGHGDMSSNPGRG